MPGTSRDENPLWELHRNVFLNPLAVRLPDRPQDAFPRRAKEQAVPHSRTHDGQSLKSAVADLVVRTMQDYTGRGATRARTIIDQDTILVVLEDTLTKGERVLVEHGREEDVLRIRRTFQETMRQDLSRAVEQLVGRRVDAFMSTNHTAPDYAIEIFMLGEPLAGDPSSNGR